MSRCTMPILCKYCTAEMICIPYNPIKQELTSDSEHSANALKHSPAHSLLLAGQDSRLRLRVSAMHFFVSWSMHLMEAMRGLRLRKVRFFDDAIKELAAWMYARARSQYLVPSLISHILTNHPSPHRLLLLSLCPSRSPCAHTCMRTHTCDELHDDVEFVLRVEHVVKSDTVRVFDLGKHRNF
jgi:hypothetical protein